MAKDNTIFDILMTNQFYVVNLIAMFSNWPPSKIVMYYVI